MLDKSDEPVARSRSPCARHRCREAYDVCLITKMSVYKLHESKTITRVYFSLSALEDEIGMGWVHPRTPPAPVNALSCVHLENLDNP